MFYMIWASIVDASSTHYDFCFFGGFVSPFMWMELCGYRPFLSEDFFCFLFFFFFVMR